MVSGTETIDGITYTYAADGTYVKTNTSVVSASNLLDSEAKKLIPEVLLATSGETYGVTKSITGSSTDTETTYYNGSGEILGYKTVNSYSYGSDTSTTSTYNDADWNWVGSSWSDTNDQGVVTSSGFNFRMNQTEAVDIDGGGDDFGTGTAVATYVQETGESNWKNGSYDEKYEYQYNFDSSGNFLGGFEISNGIKTTWGKNWVNLGQSSTLDLAQAVA